MKIEIKHEIGKNCITLDSGKKLYELIYEALRQNQDVDLDFDGVMVYASPFFNAAIGYLLKDIPPEALNKYLHFHKLSDAGMEVLKRVIENSKEYYLKPEIRKALDDILKEQAEDK